MKGLREAGGAALRAAPGPWNATNLSVFKLHLAAYTDPWTPHRNAMRLYEAFMTDCTCRVGVCQQWTCLFSCTMFSARRQAAHKRDEAIKKERNSPVNK